MDNEKRKILIRERKRLQKRGKRNRLNVLDFMRLINLDAILEHDRREIG